MQREIKRDIKFDMWGTERSKLGPFQGKREVKEVGINGGASVERFLEITTASVNRMARPENMTELDGWDK